VADSGGLDRIAKTIGGLTAVVLAIVGLKAAIGELFPSHTLAEPQVAQSAPAEAQAQAAPAQPQAAPNQVPADEVPAGQVAVGQAQPRPDRPGISQETDADYVIPGSDARRLQLADVQDLPTDQLRIARNEIYARHGRVFQDPALRRYFSSKSWYRGVAGTVELSPVEQANVQLIQSVEAARGG
jgi:hypothetical protein